jgi:hypothetical protein
MFGMEHVVSVCGVFLRLLRVGLLVRMPLVLARILIEFGCGRLIDGGGNGCLDRGRNRRLGLRFGYRCMLVAVFVMIMIMIVFVMVIVVMFMIGRMLVMFMRAVLMRVMLVGLVMLRIGAVFGRLIPERLRGLRRIGAGVLDDLALDAVAMTAAA